MKKYLPKLNNLKGFTLIELLVVIAIVAVLAVVAIALFTGTQSKARDAKRVQDITAMSKAMEVNYVAGTGYISSGISAPGTTSTWFADQVMPSNPTPGGAAYGTNAITVSSFTFCTTLENSTGNATALTGTGLGTTATGVFFCRRNTL